MRTREDIQAYQKIYCQINKVKRREYMRVWEANNRDKIKIYNARRKAKQYNTGKVKPVKNGSSIAELGIKEFMKRKKMLANL